MRSTHQFVLLVSSICFLTGCTTSRYVNGPTGEILDATSMAALYEKSVSDSWPTPLQPSPKFIYFVAPRMELGMKAGDVVVQIVVDGNTGRIVHSRVKSAADAYTAERVLSFVRQWVYAPFDSGTKPNRAVFEIPLRLKWEK